MDNVTHIFLGGAAAYAVFGDRLGQRAFWVGALAGTIPDLDILIHTGDTVRDHLLHRHFTHSLVMVPVIAAIAALPFIIARKMRAMWASLFLAALVAAITHPICDLLTSYGTMIFWPFTERRYATDTIAVVDPFYTLPLVIGMILALKHADVRTARATLAITTAYLAFAAFQHERAMNVQRTLILARGQTAVENPRVLPQIGAALNYRSIYIVDGVIHADAIRVPPLSRGLVKLGETIDVARDSETRTLGPYVDFADGYVARVAEAPQTLADVRYSLSPERFDPIWGVDLSGKHPEWRMFRQKRMLGKMWRELVSPRGYFPPAAD
jgi:inner membrane protein